MEEYRDRSNIFKARYEKIDIAVDNFEKAHNIGKPSNPGEGKRNLQLLPVNDWMASIPKLIQEDVYVPKIPEYLLGHPGMTSLE